MRRVVLFVTIIFGFPASSVLASQQFYTKHEVNYVFDTKGQAAVEQRISLTNKQSNLYVSGYQLSLTGDPPGLVTGHDSTGPLQITTTHPDSDTTNISVKFNDQIAGKDKTLSFTLNYLGRAAVHNGQVWEVSLPRIGETDQIDEYVLHLTVPDSYGKPAFISPPPNNSSGNTYTFTKEQISRVGVVAAFGNFQTFNFNLSFDLTNPSSKTAIAQIPLPADSNYQRVFYFDIDPKPSDVTVDEDGNWIATYRVAGKKTVEVTARGQVHLLAEPTKYPPIATLTDKSAYLAATPYWPADDPVVKQLAARLKTAEEIYNYVVDTLSYDYSRAKPGVVRLGGKAALESPDKSLCTEFTDLFITIARAAGIPAREVDGYAYTTDPKLRPLTSGGDIFHAWPQYWNESSKAWISIDPTWGSTTGGIDYFHKLDFNHFAFLARGLSDSSPALATSKIDVQYGTYQDFPPANPKIVWTPPFQIWPLVNNIGRLSITNPVGQAAYRLPVTVTAQNIPITYQGPAQVSVLPPFTSRVYPVAMQTSWLPDFKAKSMLITVGGLTTAYNISSSLFLAWQILLGITAAIIITSLAWLTAKAWGLYLQKHRK